MARRPVDDPYVHPGTLTLRNWLGPTDAGLLSLAEYAYTRQRTTDAPPFPLTPHGFKSTHKHLFEDIFPWAGQVRTVGLTHPRHQDPFASPTSSTAPSPGSSAPCLPTPTWPASTPRPSPPKPPTTSAS